MAHMRCLKRNNFCSLKVCQHWKRILLKLIIMGKRPPVQLRLSKPAPSLSHAKKRLAPLTIVNFLGQSVQWKSGWKQRSCLEWALIFIRRECTFQHKTALLPACSVNVSASALGLSVGPLCFTSQCVPKFICPLKEVQRWVLVGCFAVEWGWTCLSTRMCSTAPFVHANTA